MVKYNVIFANSQIYTALIPLVEDYLIANPTFQAIGNPVCLPLVGWYQAVGII